MCDRVFQPLLSTAISPLCAVHNIQTKRQVNKNLSCLTIIERRGLPGCDLVRVEWELPGQNGRRGEAPAFLFVNFCKCKLL